MCESCFEIFSQAFGKCSFCVFFVTFTRGSFHRSRCSRSFQEVKLVGSLQTVGYLLAVVLFYVFL